MYSSKISALKEKLASKDAEERESVYGLLTSAANSWEDAFTKAPFDCIAALSPHLRNPADPRILPILLPWIAGGRTEGVKKTPVALVGSTISLLVHHIKIGGRTAPAPQKECDESMESEYFNPRVDLTRVVPLVKKVDEILGQLSPREYMLIDNAADRELSELLLEVILDSEARFADEFHTSRLVVALVHKIAVFLNVLSNGPKAEQEELELEKHPFVKNDVDLRLGGLWLKINISHFFPSNYALKEATEIMEESLKPFRSPTAQEFTRFLLDKDYPFLETKIVTNLNDVRRWLFLITQLEVQIWSIVWKPNIKSDLKLNYIDQSIPNPEASEVKVPKSVKQIVRPYFLKYFDKLQPLNKM